MKYLLHLFDKTSTVHGTEMLEVHVCPKMFLNIVFIKNKLINLGFTAIGINFETNEEVKFLLNLLFLIRINIDSNHTFANSFEFVKEMITLLQKLLAHLLSVFDHICLETCKRLKNQSAVYSVRVLRHLSLII